METKSSETIIQYEIHNFIESKSIGSLSKAFKIQTETKIRSIIFKKKFSMQY